MKQCDDVLVAVQSRKDPEDRLYYITKVKRLGRVEDSEICMVLLRIILWQLKCSKVHQNQNPNVY